MPVAVKRHGPRRVPHGLHHGQYRRAAVKGEGIRCVTQVMESDGPQTGKLPHRLPAFVEAGCHPRLPVRSREYQFVGPRRARQGIRTDLRHHQGPDTSRGLRLVDDPASVMLPRDVTGYVYLSRLKVDVSPTQRKEFALPNPQGDRQHVQSFQRITLGSLNQSVGLIGTECDGSAGRPIGSIHDGDCVGHAVTVSLGLIQGHRQRHMHFERHTAGTRMKLLNVFGFQSIKPYLPENGHDVDPRMRFIWAHCLRCPLGLLPCEPLG